MNTSVKNRRNFLKMSFIGAGGSWIALPVFSRSLTKTNMQTKDPIKSELVREFVVKGHGDLNRVKELLEQEPQLVNATWDWGGGDFETAIGGAGHMGKIDIAEFLLSKGARMDVFVAAMLGKFNIVKSTLDEFPGLKSSKGPHGLTLLHHATKGGENAKLVLDYLKEIGAS
jgi:hypothetical protein